MLIQRLWKPNISGSHKVSKGYYNLYSFHFVKSGSIDFLMPNYCFEVDTWSPTDPLGQIQLFEEYNFSEVRMPAYWLITIGIKGPSSGRQNSWQGVIVLKKSGHLLAHQQGKWTWYCVSSKQILPTCRNPIRIHPKWLGSFILHCVFKIHIHLPFLTKDFLHSEGQN